MPEEGPIGRGENRSLPVFTGSVTGWLAAAVSVIATVLLLAEVDEGFGPTSGPRSNEQAPSMGR